MEANESVRWLAERIRDARFVKAPAVKRSELLLRLVDQNIVSWNRIAQWLQFMDELKRVP